MSDKFNTYTYIEPVTGGGQREVTCHPDDVEKVKAFLKEFVKSVHIPTNKTNVGHGGYGRYSRYKIKQHKYAGGGHGGCGGFIEVLEIENPPEGRCGIVLHEDIDDYSHRGATFWEFDSLEEAKKAFEHSWSSSDKKRRYEKAKREVHTGFFSPWFYAVGDQMLLGDMVLPDYGLESDTEFISGKKYVVYVDEYCDDQKSKIPCVKTCFGCFHIKDKELDMYGREKGEKVTKVVLFDDGYMWDECKNFSRRPRLALMKEAGFMGIMDQMMRLLAGKVKNFTVKFSNGGKFVGKYIPPADKDEKGAYTVKAIFRAKSTGKEEEKTGSVDFVPSEETPTVVKFVEVECKKKGLDLVKVLGYKRASEYGWDGLYKDPFEDVK
jgi:hypothetical protein